MHRWYTEPQFKPVRYEELKKHIMQQAAAKGFGTRPAEVNVPEKILLIGSEVNEAFIAITQQKNRLEDIWRHLGGDEEFLMTRPFYDPNRETGYQGSFPERDNYREEWGDTLQRTLHLGGIFDISFPPEYTQYQGPMPPIQDFSRRMFQVLGKTYEAHDHYRHKNLALFREGLVWIAQYCAAVASRDGFDIEEEVMVKVTKNRARVWDPASLNETFTKQN